MMMCKFKRPKEIKKNKKKIVNFIKIKKVGKSVVLGGELCMVPPFRIQPKSRLQQHPKAIQ